MSIRKMLLEGGTCFNIYNHLAVKQWTTKLQELLTDILLNVFDHGIRVIEAQVEIPDFDGVELLDITAQCA